MCRHLAYLGPPCAVGELLARGEHSLLRQGWAPRDMRGGGTVNADGYGAAWWVDGAPVRYRTASPVWNDEAGAAVLASARSTAVLAAVRSATVGMPVVHTANAPFTDGRWAFSHNGTVRGWPGSMGWLAARLPLTDVLTLDAPTDSALLWAAARARLDHDDPAEVLADLVRAVGASAPESRLNLLLTDGEQVVATTWYLAVRARHRRRRAGGLRATRRRPRLAVGARPQRGDRPTGAGHRHTARPLTSRTPT